MRNNTRGFQDQVRSVRSTSWIPLKLGEGKDAFNDEGSSIESVEIEKRLTREREDFLGGDRGTQLVDNRVSELC